MPDLGEATSSCNRRVRIGTVSAVVDAFDRDATVGRNGSFTDPAQTPEPTMGQPCPACRCSRKSRNTFSGVTGSWSMRIPTAS